MEKISKNSTIINEQSEDETNQLALYMVYFILGVLIFFMIAFIYNLIKCYLPKWMAKQRSKKNDDGVEHYNLDVIENSSNNNERTV